MTEVITDALPTTKPAVLSGPSFAEEVGKGYPTAVVGAADTEEVARAVQEIFASPTFRVYASCDVVGVQMGGALKNVIAVAAGMLEGLGLGHNTRAALITRGLAEITRLGEAMGGDPRPTTPEEMKALVSRQYETWKKLAIEANLAID